MSVVLLGMPFGSLQRPNLALGLLTAALRRESIPVVTHYANLWLAEAVGLEAYLAMENSPSEGLLGEWVFAPLAFRDRAVPDPHLEQWWGTQNARRFRPELLDQARQLRSRLPAYLDQVVERVLAERPRVVGASSSFQQTCASLAVLRRLKEADPTLITILGGANCEGPMGQALVDQVPWLDFSFSGEADLMFPHICRSLLAGEDPGPRAGLLRRGQPSPVRATVPDVNVLPNPDHDDYFRALDQLEVGRCIDPGLVLETSRGCWWGQKHHCTFCGLNGGGMGYRSKTSTRVLEELDSLHRRYGVRRFEVADNILDHAHLREVLPELAERGAPYRLFYETKSNLRSEQVALLARSGVLWIQPGVESLHSRVLDLMRKGSTALMNLQLLRNAREHGVRLSWNFLAGFPGEDPEWSGEMAAFLPLLSHLQPPSGLVKIRYDRFSPYHQEPERYGIEMTPYASYGHVFPMPPEVLDDLAYFFCDRGEASRPMDHPGYQALSQAVDDWKQLWKGLSPLLAGEDDGQVVEVIDTRPVARQRTIRLAGADRDTLLACRTPQAPTQVSAASRQRLLELGLALERDGKLLSLVVFGAIPSLPNISEFPGGTLRLEPFAREYQGAALPAISGSA